MLIVARWILPGFLGNFGSLRYATLNWQILKAKVSSLQTIATVIGSGFLVKAIVELADVTDASFFADEVVLGVVVVVDEVDFEVGVIVPFFTLSE